MNTTPGGRTRIMMSIAMFVNGPVLNMFESLLVLLYSDEH